MSYTQQVKYFTEMLSFSSGDEEDIDIKITNQVWLSLMPATSTRTLELEVYYYSQL